MLNSVSVNDARVMGTLVLVNSPCEVNKPTATESFLFRCPLRQVELADLK